MTVDYGVGGCVQRRIEGLTWAAQGANSDTGTTLNSALVFGTSGGAVIGRIPALRASSIKKFYVFNNAFTGTAANLSVQCEIRSERTSGSNNQAWPGTTVRQAAVTGTWATKGAKRWIEFDFSAVPYTPAEGEFLFPVISNTAASPATDYPQIIVNNAVVYGGGNNLQLPGHIGTATNGLSAAATLSTSSPFICVIEYADGTVTGMPYTRAIATFFSASTLERGAVFDGFNTPRMCYGFAWLGSSAFWRNLNVYAGNTAPGGTAYQAISLGTTAGQTIDGLVQVKLVTPFLLNANTKYRVVLKPSGSNIQPPSVLQIEASADFPDLVLAGNAGNTLGYATVDNGAGGWTDDKSAWVGLAMLMQSDVPGSASRGIYTGSRM